MRKVEDGEKKGHEKIMLFTVATYVVTSRPPERRPTGALTTHPKKFPSHLNLLENILVFVTH